MMPLAVLVSTVLSVLVLLNANANANAGVESPALHEPLREASEQEILGRILQALGSQGIEVTDRSKLMGIAKGLGLL